MLGKGGYYPGLVSPVYASPVSHSPLLRFPRPPVRRDIMTPDYCALLLADEEDDSGAESVATNAWFGPGGTVSPLHNDPFHNLLAQVVGSKRVSLAVRKRRLYFLSWVRVILG